MNADFLLYFFLFIFFVFYWLHLNVPSPIVAIVNRWVRWIVLSLCGAEIVIGLGMWDRPYWSTILAMFLVWLLIESMYNWFIIKMLSMSRLSLFPKYTVSREMWPRSDKFKKLAAWVKENGFRQIQALTTQPAPGMGILALIYQNADSTIRLQITFVPQFRGKLVPCFSFSTSTSSGESFITDNYFLPFGGFYPENWKVERKPWCRSMASLLKRHQQRIVGETVTPWINEPLKDINQNQQKLELVNVGLGFLVEHSQQEEYGTITSAGRYRIWKEYWLLNYFGRTVRY